MDEDIRKVQYGCGCGEIRGIFDFLRLWGNWKTHKMGENVRVTIL